MFTRKSISLIAVLAALGVLGISAASASATRITPAGTAIRATSTTTNFIPENAFSPSSIRCSESSASATTPTQSEPFPPGTQNNTNRIGTGTNSASAGSVIMDISPAPTFSKCGDFVGTEEKAPATVATNTTNGTWTIAGDFIAKTAIPIAIGVPSNGATITIGTCVITVSNGRASSVMARWTNGTNSTTAPSTMRVDGQIRFSDAAAGCSGFNTANPAQFESTYSVRTNPESGTPVTWGE